ncbi:MAG: hypothetical protein CSYNP_03541 [Syntrophus sp. SKADARSKE-3]|nr:hypothetical protein [Syntrophus sp. SKADARSKE-3]
MRNDPLEATIRTKIVKKINARPLGAMQIRHQAGYAKKGDPDLTGSYRRVHVEIEVKRPGEVPTEIQKIRLAHWQKKGAMVAILRSVEGADRLLDYLDSKIGPGFGFDESTPFLFDDVVEKVRKPRKKRVLH